MEVLKTFSILFDTRINIFGTPVTLGQVIVAMVLITLAGLIIESVFSRGKE